MSLIASFPSSEALSDDEARALMERTTWYHSFALRPGLVTSGATVSEPASLTGSGVPTDLTGKRALDVGAWDGVYTFELERRGAIVAALDIQDPAAIGFDAARKIIGSPAIHYQGSVYDLPTPELRDFDLILFRGVYYHLKYPLMAFERISEALKFGGTLHFEGEALLTYVEDLEGNKANIDIEAINKANVPFVATYPNKYKGQSNWCIPNPAALTSWLIASGFEVMQMTPFVVPGNGQRVYGYARKIAKWSEMQEHKIYTGG